MDDDGAAGKKNDHDGKQKKQKWNRTETLVRGKKKCGRTNERNQSTSGIHWA